MNGNAGSFVRVPAEILDKTLLRSPHLGLLRRRVQVFWQQIMLLAG
jgi:hypothetical protein